MQSTHPAIPTTKCTAALSGEAFHKPTTNRGFIFVEVRVRKQRGGCEVLRVRLRGKYVKVNNPINPGYWYLGTKKPFTGGSKSAYTATNNNESST